MGVCSICGLAGSSCPKGAARPFSPRGFGSMPPPPPKVNLKSRSSEMQFPAFWALFKKPYCFVALKNFSGRRCVEFAFFNYIIFVSINEIQTDGGKRSYRRQ